MRLSLVLALASVTECYFWGPDDGKSNNPKLKKLSNSSGSIARRSYLIEFVDALSNKIENNKCLKNSLSGSFLLQLKKAIHLVNEGPVNDGTAHEDVNGNDDESDEGGITQTSSGNKEGKDDAQFESDMVVQEGKDSQKEIPPSEDIHPSGESMKEIYTAKLADGAPLDVMIRELLNNTTGMDLKKTMLYLRNTWPDVLRPLSVDENFKKETGRILVDNFEHLYMCIESFLFGYLKEFRNPTKRRAAYSKIRESIHVLLGIPLTTELNVYESQILHMQCGEHQINMEAIPEIKGLLLFEAMVFATLTHALSFLIFFDSLAFDVTLEYVGRLYRTMVDSPTKQHLKNLIEHVFVFRKDLLDAVKFLLDYHVEMMMLIAQGAHIPAVPLIGNLSEQSLFDRKFLLLIFDHRNLDILSLNEFESLFQRLSDETKVSFSSALADPLPSLSHPSVSPQHSAKTGQLTMAKESEKSDQFEFVPYLKSDSISSCFTLIAVTFGFFLI
jgi:hypothetical protein